MKCDPLNALIEIDWISRIAERESELFTSKPLFVMMGERDVLDLATGRAYHPCRRTFDALGDRYYESLE